VKSTLLCAFALQTWVSAIGVYILDRVTNAVYSGSHAPALGYM
jgi:hypothetical protein